MKKTLILSAFFALFVCSLSAQTNNIYQSGGISLTVGAPTYKPGAKGNVVAIDTVTGTWYISRDRYAANGNWLSMGDRIESISGCSAPLYTPNKYNSELVINNCAVPELYHHSGGGVWVCLNCSTTITTDATLSGAGTSGSPLKIAQQSATSGQVLKWNGTTWLPAADDNTGTTYTAGTGIAISGGNVISNTGIITEVDGSTTNELQTLSVASGTTTLSNSGGSMTIAGAGINSVGTAGTTITITGTEVDGSTTNELQTIANTSDATSHTVTLSNAGGSTQLVEGSNITLTTTGTSSAGIVTIAATGGGTDLTVSGSSSPLTINSSTGTDITATAGTGISLAGTSGSFTITNTGDTNASDDITGTIANTQVAYGSGTNTIAGSSNLTWDGTKLGVTGTAFITGTRVDATSGGSIWMYRNGTTNFLTGGNLTGTGIDNTAIGSNAFAAFTTNNDCVSVGVDANRYSKGNKNVAIGNYAGTGNSSTNTGSDNVAIGYGSQRWQRTTGSRNTSVGLYSIGSVTTGSSNSALGADALSSVSTGDNNVAFGSSTLSGLTTGSLNMGIGRASLAGITTGSGNVAIGDGVMYYAQTSSSYNIGIGAFALGSNYGAVLSNSLGIGVSAGNGHTAPNNCVFLGYQAGYNGTSTKSLYIQQNTGSISNAPPLIGGVFDSKYAGVNIVPENLLAAWHVQGTGSTSGTKAVIIEKADGTDYLTCQNDGKVGIGVSAPAEVLSVAGNLQLTTAGNKLKIATGSNASIGTATLVAGTVTVSTTAVATGSIIMVSCNTPGGTQGILSAPVASITNGTSFIINSSNAADTSTVNWWIVN